MKPLGLVPEHTARTGELCPCPHPTPPLLQMVELVTPHEAEHGPSPVANPATGQLPDAVWRCGKRPLCSLSGSRPCSRAQDSTHSRLPEVSCR